MAPLTPFQRDLINRILRDRPAGYTVVARSCGLSFPNLCNGTCTNTQTDPNNCGQCGNACAPEQSCTAGSCACPAAAPVACGSGTFAICTNTQTDPNNCGSCGVACTAQFPLCINAACSAGTPEPAMTVTPSTSFTTTGPVGGPFSPSSVQYTVAAASGTVNWSVVTPSWLTASASSGTASSSRTPITFTVNSNANNYGAEQINETIEFVNSGQGGGNTTRSAQLIPVLTNSSTDSTSSVNPSVVGQSVTFTAKVSPASGSGTPSGSVSVLDGSTQIGTGILSAGVATFATSSLSAGNHTITTNYGGDSRFASSTGSLIGNPQVVLKFQQVGWALASQPTTGSYHPAAATSYNSSGGTITITRSGTGTYKIAFTGFDADAFDDVQVSAYGGSSYCTIAGSWTSGANPSIPVNCYAAGGKHADSEYTMLYQKRAGSVGSASQGTAFLLADQPTTTSYTANPNYQYNSTGGINTVTRTGTGTYQVLLPGFTKSGGQVLVTTVGTSGRCSVQSWSASKSGTTANVTCINSSGAAADMEFTLAYSIGTTLGDIGTQTPGVYAFANKDTTAKYNPATAYNGLTSGSPAVSRSSVGQYSVTIPGKPSFKSSLALVTAYNPGSNYCGIVQWTTTIVYVDCHNATGSPADTEFNLTFQTEN